MAEGAIKKVGDFLGISKFGQGLATARRVATGEVNQDIRRQEQNTKLVDKLMYAYRQEKDPIKKKKLLDLAASQGQIGSEMSVSKIDPGLNLSNREILGSAANIGLNVLTPGAFKGGKLAVLGKNAALGAGFGAASGLEKNRSAGKVVGSAVGGALIGGAIGGVGLMAKAAKDFISAKTPEWIMNKAVKPALQDLKKNVKYGSDSLGKELLNDGVKGGPKKLLQIANDKLNSLEDELQSVLNNPALSEARITKQQLAPYLDGLIKNKTGVPGLSGDIKRIQNIVADIPEQLTLQGANELKRKIYNELRDVAYKLDAKLGAKAATLKQIAKGLKTEIENAVGGTIVRDINHKLSIYGRLENSMVDQLAREMRNNGIGLTDAILLAGGDTTSILALLRHLGQGTETYLAQGFKKTGQVLGSKPVQEVKDKIIRKGAFNLP